MHRRAVPDVRSAQGRPARRRALATALLAAALPAVLGAATSTAASPQATFTSAGSKTVTLVVCNGGDCATVERVVQVLDPRPVILSAGPASLTVESGQPVHLVGAGNGKPPLVFTWTVRDSADAVVATLVGADVWWSTQGQPAGSYSARLELSNPAGTAVLGVPLALTLAPALSTRFHTVTPCRVFDSRTSVPLADGLDRAVQIRGSCGVPAGARAVAANVTAVSATGSGQLTLYPNGYPLPPTTAVSFAAGVTRSTFAMLTLPLDDTGAVLVRPSIAGGGVVDVVVDVTGYFTVPAQ